MIYNFTRHFSQEFKTEDLSTFSRNCEDLDISQDEFYEVLSNSQLVGVAHLETGEIVGIVQVLSDTRWSAVINFVHVLADYRHQGVGTRLMQGVMKHLTGIPWVYVAPNDMSVASFYQQFGLKELQHAGVLMTEAKLEI